MPFQYTGDGKAQAHDIVYTALIGAVLVVVLPFTILALIKNRYGRDPARRFVPWLKASFVLFTITLALAFTQGVINSVIIYNSTAENFDTTYNDAAEAGLHIGYHVDLFGTVSAATVMVFLLELGPGMHYAIEGASSRLDRTLRYLAYGAAGVVIALALAFYGMLIDYTVNDVNAAGQPRDARTTYDRRREINDLMGTTDVILFGASLVITGLSVYTFAKRKFSPVKNASTLYLAAGLLNLLSSTWNFAYAVNWLFMDPAQRPEEYYVYTLNIILGWWSRGVLLVLGFFVAVKSGSAGGVWSHTGEYGSMDSGGKKRKRGLWLC